MLQQQFRAYLGIFAICLATPAGLATSADPEIEHYDVVIYGGTSASITAAIACRQMGHSIVIVSPDQHLGGLTTSGLGWTDSGKKAAIGGLALQFYQKVYQHYQSPQAWRQQTKESYGTRSQGDAADIGHAKSMWVFEPHVAEKIIEDWVAEHQIPVLREKRLDRNAADFGVNKQGLRIQSIRMTDGTLVSGKMFIDTTYEGDLMAAAGVETTYGRESNSQYGETYNGNQVGVLHHSHFFAQRIDPYLIPGDPSSGLLPRIDSSKPGVRGEADKRIQAYCFRMCLTNDPDNRIAFSKPDGYDPNQYELLLRVLDTGWDAWLAKYDPLPNRKTDTNNHGPFSTDNIGMNDDYPTATDRRRAEIIAEHERYQKGLMYFMANDPRVPTKVRQTIGQWGLCKDEFTGTSGWPHQLYIREARRMVGQYVMTELDCLDKRETPDSVGLGSYTLDSHNVRRYVTPEGYVQNEGDIGVHTPRPYRIAYGSIVPKRNECENLLVPVCVSSSHIAYGSIRMEPVFMILGQSAATAAVMAIEGRHTVQDLDYESLRQRLLHEGQVLQWFDEASQKFQKLEGIVIDDSEAVLTGDWVSSTSHPTYYKYGYRHNQQDPAATARFETDLDRGRYEVRIVYPHNKNRTTAANIVIQTASGVQRLSLDQTQKPSVDDAIESLGIFEFDGPSSVSFSADSENGFLVIDAAEFLKVVP
jgi:hypothetical protein